MKKITNILLLCFCITGVGAQPGLLDPNFVTTSSGDGTGINNQIWTSVTQADQKIIVGGQLTAVNGFSNIGIARLNANGSIDGSFSSGTGFDGIVYSVALQTDGKIIAGGTFTVYNGTTVNRIVRLNTDGSLDGTFTMGTGFNGEVRKVYVQTDGRILVVGNFTTYNGQTRRRLVRLNSNGTLHAGLNVGAGITGGNVFDVTVQSDDKIIVGGAFTNYDGTAVNRIMRINSDGSLDGTFNTGTGPDAVVRAITLQADGKVLIGGNFTNFNGSAAARMLRVNANGSTDGSFGFGGSGFSSNVWAIALQSDGKSVVGGEFANFNGVTAVRRIARLNTDGTRDAAFTNGNAFSSTVRSIHIQPNGRVIAVGNFTTYASASAFRIARLYGACETAIIDTQPAVTVAPVGGTANFTVVSENGTGYQWQVNSGSGFTNLSNGGHYSGVTTPTLVISNVAANLDANVYRCVVNACTPTNTAGGRYLFIGPQGSTYLNGSSCGATNLLLTNTIQTTGPSNATNYEWQFINHNIGYNQTVLKGSSSKTMMLTNVPGLTYGNSYAVRTRAFVNGVWTNYGPHCMITLAPAQSLTKVRNDYCGATVNFGDVIYADAINNATNFEWRFTDGVFNTTKLKGNGNPSFTLSNIPGLQYGVTYDVDVRYLLNGVWSSYGSVCQLSLSNGPAETRLTTQYCGATGLTTTSTIQAMSVPNATNYEYEFVNTGLSFNTTVLKGNGNASFNLASVTGLVDNEMYEVRVRAYVNGVWGSFGIMCTITMGSSGREAEFASENNVLDNQIALTIFPNPVTDFANLRIENLNGEEAQIIVLDMEGRLIEAIQWNGGNGDIAMTNFGSLSAGMYFIRVSTPMQSQTIRFVKQ